MPRFLILLYGLLSYAIGLGGLVFFILYLGRWSFMPLHVNSSPAGPAGTAILVNLGLLLLWGVQHSIMARPRFKKAWTRIIPPAAERSTYVLLSGVIIFVMAYYWQPIAGGLWNFENSFVGSILTAGYIIGWVMVVVASFLINHFELFGLQQVYLHLKQKSEPDSSFTDRYLYKVVRHPIQLGVLIGVWCTSVMTYTHLMIAAGFTIYIFIGLHYEEKDLVASLGDEYEEYKSRVPKVIPFTK